MPLFIFFLLSITIPSQATICSFSNLPDPFDNIIAGQYTSFDAAAVEGGANPCPPGNSGGFNPTDLYIEIRDGSNTLKRKLWADNTGSLTWPNWDGRVDWDIANDRRGGRLAYGSYSAKLFQDTQITYSTKIPTIFLIGTPTDIALGSDGTIWVLNNATRKVTRYSSGGTLLLGYLEVTVTDATSRLHGIAVSNADNAVYVAEYNKTLNQSRIQKYDLNGSLVDANFIPYGGNPALVRIEGLDLDAAGAIYVADFQDKKVKKFPKTGGNVAASLTVTIPNDACNLNAYEPRDIAIDTNGDIYIIEGQNQPGNQTNDRACIQAYTSAGARIWAKANEIRPVDTAGTECNPLGIDIDESYIYASCGCDSDDYLVRDDDPDLSCGDNSHTLLVYQKASAGTRVSQFGTPSSPGDTDALFNVPHGLAVDTTNDWIYVVESANNRVKKLNLDYVDPIVLTFNSHIVDLYSVQYPGDMAVDNDGNAYVSLTQSGLIKKFDKDGNFICQLGGTGENTVGKFQQLSGLGVSDDGYYIYASDVKEDNVEQFIMTDRATCAGTWTNNANWPQAIGQGPDVTRGPAGITVAAGAGSSAQAYIAEDQTGKVQIRKPDGTNGAPIPTVNTCATPKDVAIDSLGYIYVVCSDAIIEKYTPYQGGAGTKVKFIDGGSAGTGIAVDEFGNVWWSESADDRVYKSASYIKYDNTNPAGEPAETHEMTAAVDNVGGFGTDTAKFNDPYGIDYYKDSLGNEYIWVVDKNNNRIQRFKIAYVDQKNEQVTINTNVGAPNVSSVSISPASPVPSGQLEVRVNYTEAMKNQVAPMVAVYTQNNCPLTVYDEAVALDADSSNTYSAGDTILAGITPVLGTALVAFVGGSSPYEKHYDADGNPGNGSAYAAGNAIIQDTNQDNTYDPPPGGTELIYFATTSTNAPVQAFNSNEKHTDNGPTANRYDGYYASNEWRGWVAIPSGATGCCGGSCDGTAQVRVENGRDIDNYLQDPNPWDCNTANPCFQFLIDTAMPTEPTITSPADDSFTSLNSVAVSGSYNDTNGAEVTVVTTDFSCVVREAVASNNNVYNAAADSVIYGNCADGTALIPMTTKEGWVDMATGTANVYDVGEPIIGDYYNIDGNDPRYDAGTEPCSNCDRILLNLGTYVNLDSLKKFTALDSRVKLKRTSSQTVSSTGIFAANDVGLPNYSVYYISAQAKDTAGNYSPYTSKRIRITRGSGNPGVASVNPSATIGIDSTGVWTIRYTAGAAYDYPADSGDCACGANPSTDANCYITLTLPTGWVQPTETPNLDGTVSVSATGDTLLCAADTFSVSGQTIKVHIDKMNGGQDINITYGYQDGGSEVTNQASLGGNTFSVKSKNTSDPEGGTTVPPETGKTLTINVEGRPVRVSHTTTMPATIFDYTNNIQVIGLNFENTNSVGS
ncbi:MAG: NHL repeat-containing protein, partial [bacterium]